MIADDFDRLRSELDLCLAEVLELARAHTDAARWRLVVDAMAGSEQVPLPRSGTSANPAEVRSVLTAIHARYERRLAELEIEMRRAPIAQRDGELDDAMWTFRHRRLDRFVTDEVAAYIERVRPVRTIASAFARAGASAPAAPMLATSSTSALHRCKTCSAPRAATALYGNCIYCGHPFFTGRAEVF